jgi:sugar lactone lactonase YvrE
MILKLLLIFKKTLLPFILLFIISCSAEDDSSNKSSWNLSEGMEYPKGNQLSRAEDGVLLDDGTLIVADQRYGLAKIDLSGKVTPFGNFDALDYEHNPPKVESGPNGVHLSPDKKYVLTADVFNGKIYKSSIETNSTEILYSHEYGVNTARQDTTGSVWFTQSTENQNEERVFEALDRPIPDGALYRLSNSEGEMIPELIIDGLYFANGFYIDEKRKKFYLSEMMKNRVLVFDLDLSTGTLSNQTTLASIPTPDNMELNYDGKLWVASPLSNQILAIDLKSGDTSTVFDAQTEVGRENLLKGLQRMDNGDGFADLLTEELFGEMPGLLTGMIIGDNSQPFYVANLGSALIKVSKE